MNLSDIRQHLSKFRVGIAGAGGLGSNCAVALARSGIGELVVCDYDIVESSNLARQYYFASQVGMPKTEALRENIGNIDPSVRLICRNIRLNKDNIAEIFSGCDVVVEAFDRAEMKEMLVETVHARLPGTPLVVGSGMAGWGRNETIRFRKIDETLFVCGDESSEISEELPPMAPRVGIVANMQANAVVDILMKRK